MAERPEPDNTAPARVQHGVPAGRIPPGLSAVADMTRGHDDAWMEISRQLRELLLSEAEGDVTVVFPASRGGLRRPRVVTERRF